jgi:uncharacterized membrane protein
MIDIEESIDVDKGVRTVYDQWTQFESFPQFMEAVESVRQLDDTHLHWVVEVAGRRREWDARVSQQTPDTLIAWASTSGPANGGRVRFESLGADRTRVTLQITYEPESLLEQAGELLGVVQAQVRRDLKNFKEFIEERDAATGEWRGRVAS